MKQPCELRTLLFRKGKTPAILLVDDDTRIEKNECFMGKIAAIPAHSNPFLQHELAGWEPVHPHIRYPVTFGLYQEGSNLGLFLAPVNMAVLHSVIDIPTDDQALVLRGAQVLDDAFLQSSDHGELRPWSAVAHTNHDVDIIHFPQGVKVNPETCDVLTPILAAPEHAVPVKMGSRVAISLNDNCHAAIISPDQELIRDCLTGFIRKYAASVLESDASLPELPKHLVDPLLEPMQPGEWNELRFHPTHRYWMLEFSGKSAGETPQRWVCEGQHGHWRGGWSW